MKKPHPFSLAVFSLSAVLAAGGCGIGVQRDLSTTNPSEVVFEDMCGLQEYFDALKNSTIAPPTETFSQDISKTDRSGAVGGRVRYRFATDFQRHYLRRLLMANWKGLPEEIERAQSIEIEVRWAEKAGVRRVLTTEDALIASGGRSWYLPYQVCLSDLLFGESLYNTRRAFLNLPSPPPSPFAKKAPPEPAVAPGLPDQAPKPAQTLPASAPTGATEAAGAEETQPPPAQSAEAQAVDSADEPTGAREGEAPELAPPPQN